MPGRIDAERTTIELQRLDRGDGVPNNPHLPLAVYRAPLQLGGDPAAAFEALFSGNGWSSSWRNGIFRHHHLHATAHEVLGIARGEAQVRFGGATGPLLTVRAGDVVVIPAGVAHRNEGASGDLLVVGAYPDGTSPDVWTPDAARLEEVAAQVAQVALPEADPV